MAGKVDVDVRREQAGAGTAATRLAVLETKGLTKYYGAVLAVDSVDLTLLGGEILALIGDNGAGKSTLVKLLSGAIQPDSGEISLRGETIVFGTPLEARIRGIETIHQDLAVDPALDVAGNVYLGREIVYPFLPRPIAVLRRRAMARAARERMKDLEIDLPAVTGTPVGKLSGGQRQAVAIARASAWATEVLFMDEPTAHLGVNQSRSTLTLARQMADHGLAVVLVTHNLPHVMEYADRIVVLRHGRKVADIPRSAATPERLVSLIVGFDAGDVVSSSSDEDHRDMLATSRRQATGDT